MAEACSICSDGARGVAKDRMLPPLAQHSTHSRVAVSVAVIVLVGAAHGVTNTALTRVGPEGIEPSTRGLKVRCSAD